jgi:hypothetical protein
VGRVILFELANDGFDEIRITGMRLSRATPGRRVDLVIRLRADRRSDFEALQDMADSITAELQGS